MRRFPALLLLALTAAPSVAGAQGAPPHAWLFGTWTGGLFPAPATVTAETCLAQPSVIFTRDLVLRATLTEVTLVQRVVETARTTKGQTEFRFAPAPSAAQSSGAGLLALPSAGANRQGFGCESPDVLHVQRRSDNEIVFPGCADFPNPLVRCPSR